MFLERVESWFSVWNHVLFIFCLTTVAFVSGILEAALLFTKNFFEQMDIFPLLLLDILFVTIFSTIILP